MHDEVCTRKGGGLVWCSILPRNRVTRGTIVCTVLSAGSIRSIGRVRGCLSVSGRALGYPLDPSRVSETRWRRGVGANESTRQAHEQRGARNRKHDDHMEIVES
jgi:hypothetical protein